MRRSTAIVAYDDIQVLDVVGPLEVLYRADLHEIEAGRPAVYEAQVYTIDGRPASTASGVSITPAGSIAECPTALDTVIVAGGNGTAHAMRSDPLLEWLQTVDARSRRTASVCSGSFVLAAAGLLSGRRATTHWSECERLAALFPTVRVEPEPIYVRDGKYWTSAGVTAGMDLALALVEDDLGRDVALYVARWLVLYMHRQGGQAQFSAQLQAQSAQREPVRELQRFIAEHPDADLTVAAMARRTAMSERNFARVFAQETGTTPADYVERVRVEVARRLLEQTSLRLDDVAAACGFGSQDTLRRSFQRRLNVAPSDYRARFRTAS